LEVAFIYNEMDKSGNFKAAYYDPIQNKSKLRYVDNSNKKLVELSNEQQENLHVIIRSFIGGSTDYNYGRNEDFDHSLLVTCEDGHRRVNYYYWKNEEHIPIGVERLLEFIDNITNSSYPSKNS
jgi:hypothetical protein